jgi:hypothetical protein
MAGVGHFPANPGHQIERAQPGGMVMDRGGHHEFVHTRPAQKGVDPAVDRVR